MSNDHYAQYQKKLKGETKIHKMIFLSVWNHKLITSTKLLKVWMSWFGLEPNLNGFEQMRVEWVTRTNEHPYIWQYRLGGARSQMERENYEIALKLSAAVKRVYWVFVPKFPK